MIWKLERTLRVSQPGSAPSGVPQSPFVPSRVRPGVTVRPEVWGRLPSSSISLGIAFSEASELEDAAKRVTVIYCAACHDWIPAARGTVSGTRPAGTVWGSTAAIMYHLKLISRSST
eukprot:211919-Hanusia_phi.AAC.2